MERITITLPKELVDTLERHVAERGYANRSEACRDLIRAGLQAGADERPGAGQALAALAYVFEHEARHLAERLTSHHHEHHDMTVCSTHVHLDHRTCMEVTILRGAADRLRAHADGVLSQRGVIQGRLWLVPVEAHEESHALGGAEHSHVHMRVKDRF
jgi:CopG family nickel-responsive transcriptional regulator